MFAQRGGIASGQPSNESRAENPGSANGKSHQGSVLTLGWSAITLQCDSKRSGGTIAPVRHDLGWRESVGKVARTRQVVALQTSSRRVLAQASW